jgi:plasmid stabilization system protein ParE
MRTQLRILESAAQDIVEIAEYISDDDPNVGLRFISAIREQLRLITEFPGMGTRRSGVPYRFRGLRSWPVRGFRNYLVLYVSRKNHLEVVRVMHGARSMRRVLRGTP